MTEASMKMKQVLNSVGTRRVKVVDEESGEEIGRGVLRSVRFGVDNAHCNESEIVVDADLPDERPE